MIEITAVRPVKDGLVCRLKGIDNRTQAEALKGLELKVPRDRLPKEEAGSYYHGDLIGLAVLSRDGRTMGEVVGVRNYGAGDLIEFRRPGRRATDLIPFTDVFVPEVDVAGGRLIIDPPEGLLDE
jgi:16S rRNA processing protein RimM